MLNENFDPEKLFNGLFLNFLLSRLQDDDEEKTCKTEADEKKDELDEEFANSILDVFKFLSIYDWKFDEKSGNVSVRVTDKDDSFAYCGMVEQRKSKDNEPYFAVTLYMTIGDDSNGAVVMVHPDIKNIPGVHQINTDSCLYSMYALARIINDLTTSDDDE